MCVLGALLPFSQLLPWLVENGLDAQQFFQELFSTKIGGFFGLDVIVSAIVLFVFIFAEGKRLEIPKLWLPVVATLSVGVSPGLPLFLFLRPNKIENKA